jgi:S-DNA-T family DNA segregation ATPase FtsK/SpoIIIE
MTYSLDSLDAQAARPEVPARLHRLAHELGLMLGLLALLFWMLSLLSYSVLDAAWSTTGAQAPGAVPVVDQAASRTE